MGLVHNSDPVSNSRIRDLRHPNGSSQRPEKHLKLDISGRALLASSAPLGQRRRRREEIKSHGVILYGCSSSSSHEPEIQCVQMSWSAVVSVTVLGSGDRGLEGPMFFIFASVRGGYVSRVTLRGIVTDTDTTGGVPRTVRPLRLRIAPAIMSVNEEFRPC